MKNLHKYIGLIVFLANVHVAIGQNLTVLNYDNNEPLEFVTISQNEGGYHVTTDANGVANIAAFNRDGIIEIRYLGYETVQTSYESLKKKNFILKLKTTAFSLNQIVVSATKWQEKKSEVPGKISTISSKELLLQNPQTAADLLGSSGEVFIQKSQQGGGSPMIRGFSANRLLYTVDGVRMNTAIFRSGNIQNVISLDALSIDETEILFGAGSVIYGSDAVGGVMAFSTLKPTFTSHDKPMASGSALARYASANNEMTGHFDVNVKWKNWSYLSSLTYTDYDDLKMGRNGPDEYLVSHYVQRIDSTDVVIENSNPLKQIPTAYSQFNIMQKLAYKANENLQFTYGFHYSETSSYGRFDRHLRMKNNLPRYAKWDYGPQKWMMNHLHINYRKPNIIFDELHIDLAHQYFEESRIDRAFNKPIETNTKEQVFAYSINIDFAKYIRKIHDFNYGVELVNNVVQSEGKEKNIFTHNSTNGPSRYPNAAWAASALYVNYKYNHKNFLTTKFGVRYSHFFINADFENNAPFYPLLNEKIKLNNGALTGNAGFNYSPDKNTALRLNFSVGFRAPNIDDIGKVFDSEPGAVVVPNTQLKPEYVYNIELGGTRIVANIVKFDLAAYYTYLTKALVRRNYTLNGQDSIMYNGELSQVQAIQNASNAYVYGVQAGIEVKLPLGFGLHAIYNFQKGTEKLEDGSTSASRHAAPMFGALHFTYKSDKIQADVYSNFSGKVAYKNLPVSERGKVYLYAKDENGNPYSPGWATLNMKTTYHVSSVLGISAGVENILNIRYKTYSSGMAAPGRNFILSGRLSF